MKVKGFSAIITLLLVAFLATGLWAQSLISGDLVGTVTDAAGAVVPNATVTLKSEATGQVRTLTTNASGNYRFPLLQPGQYQVSVTAQGFANQKKAVTIAVGQAPELNFALAVKGSTEVVEVSGEAPLLQTENANTGTAFNEKQVSLLPNGGGDITAIAELAPGAVMSTGAGYGNFTVNGLPANSNVFTINGTNNMDPYFNTNNSGSTNLSLGGSEIAEAAVVSNAYSAQYGQQVGAQVTYVTKGGSNSLHGDAKYLWTGRALSARDAFNTKSDPQPFSNNNQYSANIGGPIVKDKTFFFASTEGLRYYLPTSAQAYAPSAAYQQKVLDYLHTNSPAQEAMYAQAFDYYKNAPGYDRAVPADIAYTQEQGIPHVFGDPASLIGLPAGTNEVVTWRATPSSFSKEWLMSVRFDQNFTNYDRAFFRFHSDHGLQATYTDILNPSLFSNSSNQPSYGGQAQWTHIFKSGATNQLIVSSDYYRAGFDINKAGLAAFPYTLEFLDMPFTTIGGEQFNMPQGRDVHQNQVIDDYSVRKGNHTFKFGGNLRMYNIDDYIFQRTVDVARVQFYNYDFARGNADSLRLRFPNQTSQIIKMWGLGLYAEDEYKASSKVTLTYGVRLEHNSNPTCEANCFSELSNTWDSSVHDSTIPYNQFIKTGLKNAFREVDSIAFGPRVGIAWSPFDSKKTVIRVGYGIFYDAVPASLVDNIATNYPGFTYLNDQGGYYYSRGQAGYSLTSWVQGASGCADPLNPTAATCYVNGWTANQITNQNLKTGYQNGWTYSQIRSAVLAANSTFSAPTYTTMPSHFSTPMYQKYSFEIQQQLGNNDSLTLGYAGNHGRSLAMADGLVNAYSSVDPFPGAAPDLRLKQVTAYNNKGYSYYDGLTATLTHRTRFGLQGTLSYTYSHSRDTVSSSGGNNAIYGGDSIAVMMYPGNVDYNYASSDYDTRHTVTANFVWQPHFDQWLHAPKVIGSDWSFTGTILGKTGMPFTVYSLDVPIYNGNPSYLYPSYSGTLYKCGSGAVATPCLNPDSFSDPDTTISNQRRNMFRGPGYFNMDLSVSKGFQVVPSKENMKLVIGVTAYNVLNHPNFGTPCSSISGDCGTLGQIYNTVSPATSPYGSFTGSAASARILQLNAKFSF